MQKRVEIMMGGYGREGREEEQAKGLIGLSRGGAQQPSGQPSRLGRRAQQTPFPPFPPALSLPSAHLLYTCWGWMSAAVQLVLVSLQAFDPSRQVSPFSLLSPFLQPASSSGTRLPTKTLLILSPPWLAHTQELDSLLSLLQDDSAARICRFRRRKDALRPFLLLSPCLPACLAAGQSLTSRFFKRCRVLDRSSPASLPARQGGDCPSATGGGRHLVFWQAFLRAFLPLPPLLALFCSLSFPAAGSSKVHTTETLSLTLFTAPCRRRARSMAQQGWGTTSPTTTTPLRAPTGPRRRRPLPRRWT